VALFLVQLFLLNLTAQQGQDFLLAQMRSCSQTSLSSGRASEALRNCRFLVAAEIAEPQFELFHRLLEARFLLVLDAAAHELLAEFVVFLGEFLSIWRSGPA
jgi:hypothetical protein